MEMQRTYTPRHIGFDPCVVLARMARAYDDHGVSMRLAARERTVDMRRASGLALLASGRAGPVTIRAAGTDPQRLEEALAEAGVILGKRAVTELPHYRGVC